MNGKVSAMLLTVLVTIALALAGWALATTVTHGERITRTETEVSGVKDTVQRIEHKLDRVLEQRR